MKLNSIKTDRIKIKETNLTLKTDLLEHDLPKYIVKLRLGLINYIRMNPDFLTSYEPVIVDSNHLKSSKYTIPAINTTYNEPPLIVRLMARAGRIADVGPMAAVAGAISELSMGFLLKNGAKYVIVDNGGDVAS